MKAKPLVEKFLTYNRTKEEATIARLKRDPRLTAVTLAQNLNFTRAYAAAQISAVERARKYHLAASAETMIEALRPRPLLMEERSLSLLTQIANGTKALDPDIETPIVHIPDTPVWIELAVPLFTGGNEYGENQDIAAILFFSTDHEVELLRKRSLPTGVRAILDHVARQPGQDYQWPVYFIDSDGRPRDLYYYLEHAHTWSIRVGEACPADACTYSEVEDPTRVNPGRKIKVRHPCAFCATTLAHWRSWISTALLVVAGEFAATEDAEWLSLADHTTRKVRRPGSRKYDEIRVSHTTISSTSMPVSSAAPDPLISRLTRKKGMSQSHKAPGWMQPARSTQKVWSMYAPHSGQRNADWTRRAMPDGSANRR
jgi:hypothetical protein